MHSQPCTPCIIVNQATQAADQAHTHKTLGVTGLMISTLTSTKHVLSSATRRGAESRMASMVNSRPNGMWDRRTTAAECHHTALPSLHLCCRPSSLPTSCLMFYAPTDPHGTQVCSTAGQSKFESLSAAQRAGNPSHALRQRPLERRHACQQVVSGSCTHKEH